MEKQLGYRGRLLVKGRSAVYHVVSRTSCGQFLFDDRAKEVFVKLLRKQAAFCGVEVLGYCVMSNHFHILVRVPEPHEIPDAELLRRYGHLYGGGHCPQSAPLPKVLKGMLAANSPEGQAQRKKLTARMHDLRVFMRELKQRFGIWHNQRHRNHGTIWADRYKSTIVEDTPAALSTVAAYIDLNPVRAEMVADPADYRHSSYGQAAGGNRAARAGYRAMQGRRRTWDALHADYRIVLYGKGAKSKGKPNRDRGRIDAEHARKIIANGGKLDPAQALRLRVRYFSDGAVIGTRAYLEDLGQHLSRTLGIRRKHWAHPMKQAHWNGLCSLRNLQVRPVG